MDDELCESGVERIVGVGERLRAGLSDGHARMPGARRLDELLRRVHGRDVLRTKAPHELGRERSRPAAHVEHACPGFDASKMSKLRGEQL